MVRSSDDSSPDVPANQIQQRRLAVALEGETAQTTRVVAQGQGLLADQILALAFTHDVKVRQDSALVEILSALELESEIPPIALAAVAEILSRLYQADRNHGSLGAGSGHEELASGLD